MTHSLFLLFYILTLWCAGTGLVYLMANGQRRFFPAFFALTSLLAIAALVAIRWSLNETGTAGLYAALSGVFMLWIWHESAFYLGILNGPSRQEFDADSAGPARFRQALGLSLYHETVLIGSLSLLAYLSWGAQNTLGFWCFALLWGGHQSARLNVLYGVRNIHAEWIPAHLSRLKPILKPRPLNPLFGLCVLFFALLTMTLVTASILDAENRHYLTILSVLAGLALTEHLLLVIPTAGSKVWQNYATGDRDGSIGKGAANKSANKTVGDRVIDVRELGPIHEL